MVPACRFQMTYMVSIERGPAKKQTNMCPGSTHPKDGSACDRAMRGQRDTVF